MLLDDLRVRPRLFRKVNSLAMGSLCQRIIIKVDYAMEMGLWASTRIYALLRWRS